MNCLTVVVFLTLFGGLKPPNVRALCLKTRQNLSASHWLLQTGTSRMSVVLPSTTFLRFLEVEECELTSCCLRRPHQAQTTTCVKFRVRSLSIPLKVAPSFCLRRQDARYCCRQQGRKKLHTGVVVWSKCTNSFEKTSQDFATYPLFSHVVVLQLVKQNGRHYQLLDR